MQHAAISWEFVANGNDAAASRVPATCMCPSATRSVYSDLISLRKSVHCMRNALGEEDKSTVMETCCCEEGGCPGLTEDGSDRVGVVGLESCPPLHCGGPRCWRRALHGASPLGREPISTQTPSIQVPRATAEVGDISSRRRHHRHEEGSNRKPCFKSWTT